MKNESIKALFKH